MKNFQQIGTDAGALVEEKNRAYGSSFSTAGAAMRLLYPTGIAPAQMQDALVLVRIWDKLMRIATDRDALGESPYNDIIGYGILGVHMHQATEGEPQAPCGSVSAEDAAKRSQAPSDSAPPNAPQPTMPSESEPSGKSSAMPSPPPSPSTSARTGAHASTAMVDAVSERVERARGLSLHERAQELALARNHNRVGACAGCGIVFAKRVLPLKAYVGTETFYVETVECGQALLLAVGESA